MQIKAFYPIYLSDLDHLKEDVELMEKEGFTVKHQFEEDDQEKRYVLVNDEGDRIDVFTSLKISGPRGLYGMRANVDSLDETIELAKKRGYKLKSEVFETKTNRSIFLETNTGINCYVVEHIK